MVEIYPFKGIYYNKEKIRNFDEVVSPPYDVVTKEERNAFWAKHQNNAMHLILGEEIQENKEKNLYAEAGKKFNEWIEKGILLREKKPVLYVYSQEFKTKTGEIKKRKGLIALVKLEEFEKGIILGHERTLTGPKEDRLNLMREIKGNLSSIFTLYSDPTKTTQKIIEKYSLMQPFFEAKDHEGILNKAWRITDENEIKKIQNALSERKLFIADGHHRYETALNYFKENPEADKFLTVMIDTNDSGLVIFPTHRVIYGIKEFELNELIEKIKEFFEVNEINSKEEKEIVNALNENKDRHCFALYSEGKTFLLKLKEKLNLTDLMPEIKLKSLRELDVSLLHELILNKCMGISKEMIAKKEHIDYIKDVTKTIEAVDLKKFQIGFLMNATKMSQVEEVCLAGERMPQKSTYFYPKILTGVIFNKIE
ncbi:MAG: DUF1015 domain-containing protein [Candidatus Diapherotrites archaeon]